jgi:CheY-like chemotaxis protein
MQKEKILVIDDEDFILQLSRDILSKINYDVKAISDGNAGIQQILRCRRLAVLMLSDR